MGWPFGHCTGCLANILGVSTVYLARVVHVWEDYAVHGKVVRDTDEKTRTGEKSEVTFEGFNL